MKRKAANPREDVSIAAGIDVIKRRWPNVVSPSKESPVFVLAAGWRSGSTFLQRLLMPTCFIWGEPYGRAWPVDSLAATIRCFTMHWPEGHFFYRGENPESWVERFSANLYPRPQYLLQAHLQFFEALFVEPARQTGAQRWGLKEVRLSADHAYYLKWLFPQAKFLFLFRNPYNAYRSYAARRNAGWKWYYRWPSRPLSTRDFGRHWRHLVRSYLDHVVALDGLVVRYENLAAGEFEPIEHYLGFRLNRRAAEIRPRDGPKPLDVLPDEELRQLANQVESEAASLGYFPDGKQGGS